MSTPDVRTQLADDVQELVARLAFCVAAERDRAFQQRLRAAGGVGKDQPLLVRPPASRAWLMLSSRPQVGVLRDAPEGTRRLVIDEMVGPGAALQQEIIGAIWHQPGVEAEAVSLLNPLFDSELLPSREQISRLLRWAPIIEHVAYRYFTHASMFVDQLRSPLLALIDAPSHDRTNALLGYWRCLHTMGHTLTIASTAGAGTWLSGMAASFTWENWTPTFVLLRERTLWLMIAAAKSAVAFGEGVIDKYLAKLARSDHPLKSFDALLGLVAIGLSRDDLTRSLLAELEALKVALPRDSPPGSDRVDLMFNTAIATLQAPEVSEQRFAELERSAAGRRVRGAAEILELDALRRDPTDFLPTGDVVGLLALPTIVRSELAAGYPQGQRTGRGFMLAAREINEILKRAWRTTPVADQENTLQ
jgi:hypothetical protein